MSISVSSQKHPSIIQMLMSMFEFIFRAIFIYFTLVWTFPWFVRLSASKNIIFHTVNVFCNWTEQKCWVCWPFWVSLLYVTSWTTSGTRSQSRKTNRNEYLLTSTTQDLTLSFHKGKFSWCCIITAFHFLHDSFNEAIGQDEPTYHILDMILLLLLQIAWKRFYWYSIKRTWNGTL